MACAVLQKIFVASVCVFAVFGVQPNPDAITLRFLNTMSAPNFDFSIQVETNRARTILELMEQAAWQDTTFKFSMEYHASVPGHMLNGIRKDTILNNGTYVRKPFVFHDVDWTGDKTYWSINVDNTTIPVGISVFQPKKGDTVTFELVKFE